MPTHEITAFVIASLGLTAMLIWVAVVDLQTLRIPNALNAALAGAGLLAVVVLQRPIADHLIGGVVGYGALAGFGAVYFRLRGRDGLGLGDAKLLGAGGVWIGWIGLPFAVTLAAAFGVVVLAAARLLGRTIDPSTPIAFGPFLGLGIWIVWLAQGYSLLLA